MPVNKPWPKNLIDVFEGIRDIIDSSPVPQRSIDDALDDNFDRLCAAKCIEDERTIAKEQMADTQIDMTLPVLKPPTKLDGKRCYDLLVGMKILSEPQILKMYEIGMKIKSPKAVLKGNQYKAVLVNALGSTKLHRGFGNVHTAFLSAPAYRFMAWALKQLKMPTLTKFDDFKSYLPSEDLDARLLQETLKFYEKIAEEPFFNEYNTQAVLAAFIKGVKHFENRPLTNLSDDEYNTLSMLMYGYSLLIRSDFHFIELVTMYYPNARSLAQHYITFKAVNDNLSVIFDDQGVNVPLLNLLQLLRNFACYAAGVDKDEIALENLVGVAIQHSNIIYDMNKLLQSNPTMAQRLYADSWWQVVDDLIGNFDDLGKLGEDLEAMRDKGLAEAKGQLLRFHANAKFIITLLGEQKENVATRDSFLEVICNIGTQVKEHTKELMFADLFNQYEALIEGFRSTKDTLSESVANGDSDEAVNLIGQLKDKESALAAFFEEKADGIEVFRGFVAHSIEEAKPEEPLITEDDANKDPDDYLYLLEQANCDLETQVSTLNEKLSKAQTELQKLKDSQSRQQTDIDVGLSPILSKVLFENYTNADVITFVLEHYPHVKVGDDFAKYVTACEYESPQKLLKNLCLLCGDYYQAIMNGIPDSQAKDLLPAYRANESETTMQNGSLSVLRQFKFDGATKTFTRHLTIGGNRNPRLTCQCYFDIAENVLQLAYIGPHLPVSTS